MPLDRYFDVLYSQPRDLSSADLTRARFILDRIPRAARTVLDAGCGEGHVAKVLAEKYEVTGLELSEAGVRKTQALGIKCVKGSVSEMPFPDRSFDVVVCAEVLEHLGDSTYRQSVRELARVSRSHVLITVPNRDYLPALRQECPRCRSIVVPWGHVRAFDVRSVESIFREVGLVPQRVEPFGPRVADMRHWLTWVIRAPTRLWRGLRPGLQCPMCLYAEPGLPPDQSLRQAMRSRGFRFLPLAMDVLTGKLCPKCPRWILALFAQAQN